EPEKDIYQKSHEQARGLKTERVPIIFINKYLTQFIPGKQEGYATTTKSLPKKIGLGLSKTLHYPSCSTSLGTKNKGNKA
ncbi:hypothetical protein, partial [Microcystis sp. LEGE 08355]|uniref:hypothetical protein n=1 Tax=Microcystis sp. LEGE 08355 TaxID=1828687 RepID=UPI00187E5590